MQRLDQEIKNYMYIYICFFLSGRVGKVANLEWVPPKVVGFCFTADNEKNSTFNLTL